MEKDEILEKMNIALRDSFCKMSHRGLEEAMKCSRCAEWAKDQQADR